jgi:fructose-1,6-bisphosphatase/inositol monophosphatase family enzyme
MNPSEPKISDFILSSFREAFDFINPYLSNYSEFSKFLAKEIKEKEFNNIQYNFDLKMDEIFRNNIDKFEIAGKIYSEESGWFETKGENRYRVVIDPFCASTLASKTFHAAAAGVSVFDYGYNFVASGILDYQNGIAAVADEKETKIYQIQEGEELKIDIPQRKSLKDSFIAVSFETKERRKKEHRLKMEEIFSEAERVMIGSGHYFWLKLATGYIDGYVDISKGQKLYEMFAAIVAQKRGCIVTNLGGEEFVAEKYLKIFEDNPNFRFRLVAARSKEIHKEIMNSLK